MLVFLQQKINMKKFKYILDEFFYCVKRAFAISFLLAFVSGLSNVDISSEPDFHNRNHIKGLYRLFYNFLYEFGETFGTIWVIFIDIYILITLSIFISKWWKKRKTINK